MPKDKPIHSGARGSGGGKGPKGKLDKESADEKLTFVINELLQIKQQVSKLDSIEATTKALADQLSGVTSRTSELETKVTANTARLREVNDQLSTLQTSVKKQEGNIATIVKLKEEINATSAKTISRMNELVDTQGQQVDSFKSSIKVVKKDIMKEVDKKVAKVREEAQCQSLKSQAFANRLNLIVVGLSEEEGKTAQMQVTDFFTNTLKVKDVEITTAYRMGTKSEEDEHYARPIFVRFKNIANRNKVWWARVDITSEVDNKKKIRVLADLPKALREGIQAMYKVANAASKMEKYSTTKVKDYQLEVEGEIYQFTELENLPEEIRPSTLAAPRSEYALAFYTKHSFLSNHFPSNFCIDDQTFSSMEHYLAYQKAILSEKQHLIRKARHVKDPLQAKHILNTLKDDHPEEWAQMVEEITLEGLRRKFSQNAHLKKYLCDTNDIYLGEASKNSRWGIGLELTDTNVLDHTKWNTEGNLLGRSLMKVREEFRQEGAPTNA